MSKEEAKIYLRKRLPKIKIIAGIIFVLGIINMVWGFTTRNYWSSGALFLTAGIPSVLILIIYCLLLDIRYDEICKNPLKR